MFILRKKTLEKRIETKELMSSDIVESYFPKDIKKMFGLPDEGMFFFGETHSGTDVDEYGKRKFLSNYLSLMHRPEITGMDLSFTDSDRRHIRSEHLEFMDLKESYPEHLSNSYPLLVLRLVTEYMRADKPLHYMSILRYADHENFRKRGIATSVFDSVTDRLRQDGIKYLYTCAWSGLPSKSIWMSREEVPEKDIEYISSLFYNKPKEKVLQWYDSYLRIL